MLPSCLRLLRDADSSKIFARANISRFAGVQIRSSSHLWAVFLGVMFVNSSLWACPFCSGPTQTLAERYADSEVILVAKGVPESTAPGAKREASGRYEIISVLRDKSGQYKVGGTLTHDRTALPGTRTMFLGMVSKSESGKSESAWNELVDVNETVLKYIREAPGPKQSDRLKYFERFLEHPELTIANDAYGEFANSKYEEIQPIARQMSPAKLRAWIENPKTPTMRFGLLGMLLGLCGSNADASILEKWVLEKEDKPTSGVDGMTYGYLLIRGEIGLDKLEREVLHNPTVSVGVISDRMIAIRCMWTYGDERVARERLCLTYHPLLKRPELAGTAVIDLARWKDWRVQDEVVALYGRPAFTRPREQMTIVKYLLESAKDIPEGATEIPEHAAGALQHLECLRQSDPILFAPPGKIPLKTVSLGFHGKRTPWLPLRR